MSFIDPARKFAFVHVSKTSAIIETVWRDAYGAKTNFGESRLWSGGLWIGGAHDCASFMASHCADLWAKCFSVGFVRNPWAWWLSAYHWYNPPRHTGFDFEERFPTFRDFILRWRDWRPQFPWSGYTGFLCDDNGRIMVDHVGRSERLQQDFDLICERTGFPKTILPTKADRRDFTKFYDEETKAIVAEHLSKRDIETFGLTYEDKGDC